MHFVIDYQRNKIVGAFKQPPHPLKIGAKVKVPGRYSPVAFAVAPPQDGVELTCMLYLPLDLPAIYNTNGISHLSPNTSSLSLWINTHPAHPYILYGKDGALITMEQFFRLNDSIAAADFIRSHLGSSTQALLETALDSERRAVEGLNV